MGRGSWRRIIGCYQRDKQVEGRSEFWKETKIKITRKIEKEGEYSVVI
jgi:hypothetical protein